MVREGVSSTKVEGEDCKEEIVAWRVGMSLDRSANSVDVVCERIEPRQPLFIHSSATITFTGLSDSCWFSSNSFLDIAATLACAKVRKDFCGQIQLILRPILYFVSVPYMR